MNVRIAVCSRTELIAEYDKILSFSFGKDVYTPWTSLKASFISDEASFLTAAEIKLYIGEKLIHHGLVDRLEQRLENGVRITSVSSKGFTSLLCRNQLEPGLKTSVSINSLMDGIYTLPHITHEDNSNTSSYIYVKNGSSIWDGIVNLSYKLTENYPFISGTNHVRITPEPLPENFTFGSSDIICMGTEYSYNRTLSHLHMAELDGSYGSFEYEDTFAASKEIVRHLYFEFDRQFVNEPQQALIYRAKYAKRGSQRYFCRYSGYRGEDLTDTATFGGISSKKICTIDIKGDSDGITTEIGVYNDSFYSAY